MLQFLFAVIFFYLGYLFSKNRFSEQHKKYIYSTSKLVEINFYVVLQDFMNMHNYGVQALTLTLEKCSQDNPNAAEEYKKILEVYSNKFDQIGQSYFNMMKTIFPYDLKYKSYKDVKDAFDKLIIKN